MSVERSGERKDIENGEKKRNRHHRKDEEEKKNEMKNIGESKQER